jgi:hypothetical protein
MRAGCSNPAAALRPGLGRDEKGWPEQLCFLKKQQRRAWMTLGESSALFCSMRSDAANGMSGWGLPSIAASVAVSQARRSRASAPAQPALTASGTAGVKG